MRRQPFQEVQSDSNFRQRFAFVLTFLLFACTPVVKAQDPDSAPAVGEISGTVLLSANNAPAIQVVVSVKSTSEGVSRSVLTDYEGRFSVSGLPAGTYDVVAEEAGFERDASSVQLDGASAKVTLHLKPAVPEHVSRPAPTISVRQLRIPGKAMVEYQHGLQSLAKEDLSEALKHFTKAAAAYPDFYEAQYHVGFVHLKMGQPEEAMQWFQRAVDLSKGRYAPAELGVGALLYESGKASEAEIVIRRGVEMDDSLPEGHALLGMVLVREHRTEEAEKSAREALLRRPTFAQAYLVLSDVHASRHDYREQIRDMDTYLTLQPNGPERTRVVQAREFVLRKLTGTVLQAGIPAQ